MTESRDIQPASGAEHPGGTSGRNVVAAIGIDRYQSWGTLTNAVSDACGTLALFERLGFEQVTRPLLDGAATGKAIQELVMDELRVLGPEDSLVLFYAGHGSTRTDRPGGQEVKTGYLIPVDATDRAATWIELDGWLRAVSKLPAKHILVILDACQSGIALGAIIKWRDTGTWRDTPLAALKARRSRRIITSALDNQEALDSGPVYGHSLFTGCLIDGLTHGVVDGGDRVTTGSELGLYVQRRVQTYPGSRQTPDFGTFDFDDRGELVIPLLRDRPEELAKSILPSTPVLLPGPLGAAAEEGMSVPRRQARRAWLAAGGLVALAIAVAGFVTLREREMEPSRQTAMKPLEATPVAPPLDAAALAAETAARAATVYEEGMKLFNARHLDDAIAQLDIAYRLDPRAEYLLSLARAHDERGDIDPAVYLYRRYMETAPAGAMRDLISGKLAELMTKRAAADAAKQASRAGTKTSPPLDRSGPGSGAATGPAQSTTGESKPRDLTKELVDEPPNK